jgi:hypothetical protein
LHKCGKITLGGLYIYLLRDKNEPIIINGNGKGGELPVADVPIPDNVKNFGLIVITFVFTIKFQ